MKANIQLFFDRKEIKATSLYTDTITNTGNAIGSLLGGPEIPKISTWRMLKMSLGAKETFSGSNSDMGVEVSYHVVMSKKGVSVTLSMDADPRITTEIMAAYVDIINVYAPVVTSSIVGIAAANKFAEERFSEANKAICNL